MTAYYSHPRQYGKHAVAENYLVQSRHTATLEFVIEKIDDRAFELVFGGSRVEYRPCGHVEFVDFDSTPPMICGCGEGVIKEVYET